MPVIDVFEYKYAKRKRDELQKFLNELDIIGESLYSNLSYKGVWDLISKFEEVRINNYILWHEYDQIVKKGTSNE